jgi:hypothetical protein
MCSVSSLCFTRTADTAAIFYLREENRTEFIRIVESLEFRKAKEHQRVCLGIIYNYGVNEKDREENLFMFLSSRMLTF